MICRNNESTIEAALNAAKYSGCNELAVVDTGSTDSTLDILGIHGAHVKRSTWSDDFAFHKNEALDLAAHDWCLVLDSDDTISDTHEMFRFVRNDLPRLPKIVAAIQMDVVVGVGAARVTVTQTRLIRKSSGVRFRFPIHEVVDSRGHDVYYLQEVKVVHAREFDPTHNDRNLRILKGCYEAANFHTQSHDYQQHILLNLGREYLGGMAYGSAVQLLSTFIREGTMQERMDYWANLYLALAIEDRTERLEQLHQTVKCNKYRAEAFVELGKTYLDLGDYRNAELALLAAMRCRLPNNTHTHLPDYTWRPWYLLSQAYALSGHTDEAGELRAIASERGAPSDLLPHTVYVSP